MLRALFLFLCLFSVRGAAADPSFPVWPEQFTSIQFQNRSGNLAINELWYDWPNRRNMNLIHKQQGPTVWDLEFSNGTSFYYDKEARSCKKIHFPVGILSPDWLKNATFLGTESIGNVSCYKWTKSDFVLYWENVETRVPVRWIFLWTDAQFEVMSFHEGAVVSDELWQTPDFCYKNTTLA